uniref:ADAM metallopeptidase with thrombospondin type 1 motif 7 n=1 Tax=Esox lucius TaxID=8010 RepID=A0A6Q2XNM5_ESOLU
MIYLHSGLRVVGQTFSPIHFLVATGVLAILDKSKTFGFKQEAESFLQELPHYEVVHPSRVDAKGHFLSNFVSHRVSRLRRRETQDDPGSLARVFYQLQHGDHHLLFNLTLNPQLLAPGFLIERRYGGLEGAKISNRGSSLCHFIGEVWDRATVKGRAAISTCAGLTGLFRLSEEEFFIQPLEQPSDESSASQAHVIYKRHTRSTQSQLVQSISGVPNTNSTCGVKVERQRERWERRQRKKRRIRQRSVSREKWVETLVVADSKMVEYHGSSGVESYVLAVMNIVSGLFRDASIGNPINIVVVRLILLEKEEEDLKISHHADNSLNSFCKWQKRLNVKGEENAVHHDVAVLITRKDICAAINKPCETLGLSHVAGMCQPHRSCSISEDTGLPLAFTIAHELGHNFGIQHDGNGNDCEPIGKRPFVMSPQLLYGNARPSWSRCSRQYITRFLDRGWGWCLDDPPLSDVKDLNSVPPGVLYSAAHQCRLQYGSGSLLCDDVDNVCSTLWCTVGVTCHSKLDGAVDGTRCGEDKWCFDGECVAVGYRPESVNGGWAAWSEWSACSRTCGGGVQNAHRDCVNPVPKYGGKYCTGERRRYKICNSSPCPLGQPSFRHVQCNHFNTMPYKGKFYKWVQVNNRVNPCELHCRPVNEYFSEKMLDAAIDGTQCYEGSTSRDMCINGICKNVGCDYKIDSNAVEDRCGVCHGNGSTCETVKKTFEESEGLGYVDIGLIPEGARDIRIEEVAEAGNFLALRSDDPDKYFLNGGWTIQWNGEYKAAGTVFTYERTGHLENLTSPGPTLEPVWIQLLFQETNPGVRYEYTIHRENLLDSDNNIPDFFWKYGSWTECSSTCGTGVQRQIVHCVERTSGIVEDRYCDPTTRPDDKRANCNEELCPAIWWVGEWQKCSATCGEQGLAKRTVLCIQAVGLEEKRALQPSECHHMPRPDSVTACNTHIPCPADWSAGNWSECSLTCGGGVRSREVVCSRNTGVDCDPRKKPSVLIACYLKDCPQIIDIGNNDWSGSGSSSINSIPEANPVPKHSTTRGQPKANNGNNIIPQRNDIEKTPDKSAKNNVPVDDFYYDYNFIKFHEDISYDFDLGSNGKDLGDAPGLVPQQKPKIDSSAEENVYRDPTTYLPTTVSPSSTTTTTGSQAEMESLVPPLESPSLGTVLDYKIYQDRIFTMTLAQPDEAQTPTTTLSLPFEPPASDSTEDYNGYFPGEPDFDQQDLENESTSDSKADLLVTGRDLTEASKPVTQEPRLSPSPHTAFGRTISENKGNIKHNSATTGSESIPPTHPEVVPRSRPPSIPTETEPATDEQGTDFPTQSSTTGGRQSEGASVRPPAPPRNRWLEIDYNEILVPPMLRSRGTVSSLTHQPPMGATPTTPRDVKRSMPSTLSPGPTTLPARSPTTPLSAPELTPLPSPVVTAAFWRAGDWSACSTSCGLGAIWRLVTCSTGLDTDCGLAERPVPARRCYLRPCSLWRLGNWTKCSKNCGSGVTSREIQCFDTRDQRPLRPFHCQIMSTRPVAQMPCNTQPCLTWYSSSWGQCSEVCGGGEQQRLVTCPEENRCDEDFVPSNIQACNSQPCAQWVTGSWGPCSASCGGGVQRRLVKCVNTKVENEEEHAQCDHEPWPENTQKCNLQDCDSIPAVEIPKNPCLTCLRDRLTFRFCQTLRWLGRCHLPTVQAQCCKTCGQRSRGDESSTRR